MQPSFITWHTVFIRCWLHVPLFNAAQQCFTTSWTQPKSWQADKLGSATKMCVYCIELLLLKRLLREPQLSGLLWNTHSHSHAQISQIHVHTELAGFKHLFLLQSHGSSSAGRAVVRVGGTQPGQQIDDHLQAWALKTIWYVFWRQLVWEEKASQQLMWRLWGNTLNGRIGVKPLFYTTDAQ